MKSDAVYRQLRLRLADWFRADRFKRAPRTPLGWVRPPLLVWLQCHPNGWDTYLGSSFFVNFQQGSNEPWGGPSKRLQEFLTDEELETARAIHNSVVPKFQLPPREHVQAMRHTLVKIKSPDPDDIVDTYLSLFRPREEPYVRHRDFSLAYRDAADLDAWAAFILRVLPRIVEGESRNTPSA